MDAMQARIEAVNASDEGERAKAIDRYDVIQDELGGLKPEPPTKNYESEWNQVVADMEDLHKRIADYLASCPPGDIKGLH